MMGKTFGSRLSSSFRVPLLWIVVVFVVAKPRGSRRKTTDITLLHNDFLVTGKAATKLSNVLAVKEGISRGGGGGEKRQEHE